MELISFNITFTFLLFQCRYALCEQQKWHMRCGDIMSSIEIDQYLSNSSHKQYFIIMSCIISSTGFVGRILDIPPLESVPNYLLIQIFPSIIIQILYWFSSVSSHSRLLRCTRKLRVSFMRSNARPRLVLIMDRNRK